MAQQVGERGLAEVNLTIPQDTTLTFEVEHTDDAGHAIDHGASLIRMAIWAKGAVIAHLDTCCIGTETGVTVRIPTSVSSTLPLGHAQWDMIASMVTGDVVRLCYGSVQVVDTYAHDE